MFTILLTLAACTSSGSSASLRDRDWTLVWIEGFSTMPANVATPTIRFGSDGRLGGNTGCNSAGANYSTEADRITIDALISTKRACVEEAGNRLETAYVRAIDSTRRYRIVNDQLELLDDSGTVLARFRELRQNLHQRLHRTALKRGAA